MKINLGAHKWLRRKLKIKINMRIFVIVGWLLETDVCNEGLTNGDEQNIIQYHCCFCVHRKCLCT